MEKSCLFAGVRAEETGGELLARMSRSGVFDIPMGRDSAARACSRAMSSEGSATTTREMTVLFSRGRVERTGELDSSSTTVILDEAVFFVIVDRGVECVERGVCEFDCGDILTGEKLCCPW